jgi:hypothetical protein
MKFFITGTEKRWPFNTGDCLIDATTWPGFINIFPIKNTQMFLFFLFNRPSY